MSTDFQVDREIDKIVDKLSVDLKTKLKKIVIRSEKMMIKQYIASQKDTTRSRVGSPPKGRPSSRRGDEKVAPESSGRIRKKAGVVDESSSSDSD
jgi:hypothetical protein